MRVLITGAAGNLGSRLARHLLQATDHQVNLMVHTTPLPPDIGDAERVRVFRCDLADPESLDAACAQSDAVVHFAGVLFRPHPELFLPTTNTQYTKNLIDKSIEQRVRRFILISFPHVEGPTTREHPCTNRLDGKPISIHARTRLAAERYLFSKAEEGEIEAISLRPGMVYSRDLLMVAFARRLAGRRLLGVWREPTPIHLISLDDFLVCCTSAIDNVRASGIYPLGDDGPITLQEFLDVACQRWGVKKPWRVPSWSVCAVAWACEKAAGLFSTRAPLTKDFIDIGRVPYCCDTSRMKADLLRTLKYPTLDEGRAIL